MEVQQFEQLCQEGYDLNVLFLLSLPPEDIRKLTAFRIQGWIDTAKRKQLLTGDYRVTLLGQELLSRYNGSTTQVRAPGRKQLEEWFEEWWEAYPSTDYFEHKGETFVGTQSKRILKYKGKQNCWDNFAQIVNEGTYTPEDIIRATKFHILTAKANSIRKKENQLTFIPNSERYLRIQAFAPFVKLSKNNKPNEPSYSTEG